MIKEISRWFFRRLKVWQMRHVGYEIHICLTKSLDEFMEEADLMGRSIEDVILKDEQFPMSIVFIELGKNKQLVCTNMFASDFTIDDVFLWYHARHYEK
jgi:hypothetical protein